MSITTVQVFINLNKEQGHQKVNRVEEKISQPVEHNLLGWNFTKD